MGAAINGEGHGAMSIEHGKVDEIGASDPVVYQLVRVHGDGTLIPATDDELIEFEHFVEDESKLSYPGCGARQSDSVKVDSKELVGKEPMDVDGPSFMLPNLSNSHAKRQFTEDFSETESKEARKVVEGSVSETSNSRPDFCLLEGEICLDNYSIRELQEAFRATFGRYTSIKDKLWLKRRITMGLTNSCDVPSAKFFIKDNKIVLSNVKVEKKRRPPTDLSGSRLVTMNKSTSLSNETLGETVVDAAVLVEDMQALSNKGADKSLERCNEDDVNNQMEQSIKRIRRPTKRYIEELSEVEATECSGRLASLDKISVQDQYFFKSRIRTTCAVDTSQDLLGGYDTRIPCVHRARRRRPRKNFLALMNFVHMDGEKGSPKVVKSEPLSPQEEHEKFSLQDIAIHEDADAVPTVVATAKRKHHRAWTLAEVLKLVEGVSRYGAGKWSEIRRVSFSSGSNRTSVDLKDKWRNLLKASFAQMLTDKGPVGSRKPTSLPIPASILRRVRDLAEKHSQSGTEFVSTQFFGHGGIKQENETEF